MTDLQPLHMNWLLFAFGLIASVAGAAIVTYGTVPLLSIRSAWQVSGRCRRTVWLGTVAFTLSHLFAPLALNIPIVSSYYLLHVLFTLAGCYAATLFNFRYAGRPAAGSLATTSPASPSPASSSPSIMRTRCSCSAA